MRQAALVRADDEHQLRAARAVHLRRKGHGHPRRVVRRVAVEVEHHLDGRILLQIALDGLPHPLIRAVIAGIIVERRVVERLDAVRVQQLGDARTEADDGMLRIPGAERISAFIFPSRLLRVRLGRVRVDDEHLRPVRLGSQCGRTCEQRGLVRRVSRCPGDRDDVRLGSRKGFRQLRDFRRELPLRWLRIFNRQLRGLVRRLVRRFGGQQPHGPDARLRLGGILGKRKSPRAHAAEQPREHCK